MSYQKNDIVTITIEDMGHDGEGIGKIDGYPFFVKDAVIGDKIEAKVMKAKKNYAYARLMRLLEPSPFRVETRCAYARQCGGCQIQALSYEEQLRFKENKVRNHLMRIGGFSDVPIQEVIGMEEPFFYRNKAQFPVGRDKEGNIIAGFYASRTHTIINNRKCYLGVDVNEEILNKVIDYINACNIEPYDETTGKGLVRHVLIRYGFASKEIMVCLVVNGNRLPKAEVLIDSLRELEGMTSITININKKHTNVILGEEIRLLWGQTYITDSIGEVKFQISPLSFYQVNPVQTKKLYERALEYAGLTGAETVWDLYCGIGTISLFLAQKAKQVYGVEIVPQAIEDARKNAELNGIQNASFYVGKAEEVLPEKYEQDGIYADVIVVDPPRKGCEESLLCTMVEMGPKRIVYVSCDSATLARDVKWLGEHGYEMERVTVVDQFGMTVHVETVVLLSHKSPDSHIDVKVEFGEGKGKMPLGAIAERAKKYQPKPKITYKMIQEYVEKNYGFKLHTAYIAEVKRSLGLTKYDVPYAVDELKQPRKHPPKEKVEAIKDALKYFEVI